MVGEVALEHSMPYGHTKFFERVHLTLGKEAAKMVVEEREGHATATLIATAKLTGTHHLSHQFLVVLCDHYGHSHLTPNALRLPLFSPQRHFLPVLLLSRLFVPPTSDARLVWHQLDSSSAATGPVPPDVLGNPVGGKPWLLVVAPPQHVRVFAAPMCATAFKSRDRMAWRNVCKEKRSESGGGWLSGKFFLVKMRCCEGRKARKRGVQRDEGGMTQERLGVLVPMPAAYDQEHTPTSHAAACMLPERHWLVTWSPISGKDPWIGRGGMQWRRCVRTTSSRVIDESSANFDEHVKKAMNVHGTDFAPSTRFHTVPETVLSLELKQSAVSALHYGGHVRLATTNIEL
ncbi:hypothetical protein B0H13DRAFT_2264058 [Mycena leptocephala]|nr:hypothetical protein B0H13DRAFT_2264058 [Mycena leptocephala]